MISCDLASDLKSYEQMVVHRKIKDQNDHRTYSNIKRESVKIKCKRAWQRQTVQLCNL